MQFAAALPALRARVASDIKLKGLIPRERTADVSLLEKSLIRDVNAEYAEKRVLRVDEHEA
jgi:DNA topoisomerase I